MIGGHSGRIGRMEQRNTTTEVAEPRTRHNKTFMVLVSLAMTVFLTACVDSTPSAPPPVSESPTVTIKDMRFTANHVTIEQGDTVTWVWDDGDMPHDAEGDGFKSEAQSDGTFTHTFDEAGTYPYVCNLHSGMKGTVTVVDA